VLLIFGAPVAVQAQKTPEAADQAWQQTWELARQHFPSLQATEFHGFLTGEPITVCQVSRSQEMDAFFNSKYGLRDAEILAKFWNQGVDDSKAQIGRKLLFGGSNVTALDQDLANGRNLALRSVQNLTFFTESYRFQDAEALAKFWGEQSTLDAKLRMERKIILGDEATVQAQLRQANANNSNNNNSPGPGRITLVRPLDGQTVSNTRPEVSATFSAPFNRHSVSMSLDGRDRTQELSFSGNNQEVSWIPSRDLKSGTHMATIRAVGEQGEAFSQNWSFTTPAPNNNNQGNGNQNQGSQGSLSDLRPSPGQSVTGRRPEVTASFSGRPLRQSVVLLVDSVDRTQELAFSANDQFIRWNPTQDLPFGNHAVEVRAVGQNGETFGKTWTFSTPSSNNNNNNNNQSGVENFYDKPHNFGLTIPVGWTRGGLGNNMVLQLNNQGSTFQVFQGVAQSPQATVAAAKNLVTQQGGQIQNEFPTQLAGMSATRVDYALPRKGLFGQMIICVTGRNQSFVVSAESANFNTNPIGSDIKSMFHSFLINAR